MWQDVLGQANNQREPCQTTNSPVNYLLSGTLGLQYKSTEPHCLSSNPSSAIYWVSALHESLTLPCNLFNCKTEIITVLSPDWGSA